MKEPLIVRLGSPSDAAAAGAVLLGFQPAESVVAIAYDGRSVLFGARADLVDAAGFGTAVLDVLRNTEATGIHLIGYSADPPTAADALHRLTIGPLDGLTIRQHVTDGSTAWRCESGELLEGEPLTPTLDMPHRTRADSVADVTSPRQPASLTEVNTRLSHRTGDELLNLLTAALTGDDPLTPEQAADAATVLGNNALLIGFDHALANPERVYTRAVEMRRWSPDEHHGDTLALIALAAWATGRGTTAAEAVTQLDALQPELAHLLGALLHTNPNQTTT